MPKTQRPACRAASSASGRGTCEKARLSKFLEQLLRPKERWCSLRPAPTYTRRRRVGVAQAGALLPPTAAPPPARRWVSMATGRGRLLQLYWRGLQALRLPPGGVGAATGPDGEAAGPAGFR